MTNKIEARNYRQQPWWFHAINGLWRGSYILGTEVSLEKDELIKTARKLTGLHDLGPYFWDEPLDRMLLSLNEESRLHPVGRFITRQRLIQLLSVRLRAEEHFRKHPQILEQPLYPVMLVIGLQRTGTTKLQRLLASDPDNRSLLSWEALNPAPLEGDTDANEKRIRLARTSEKAVRWMSPGFFAIHPIEHLAPEEDVLLFDVSFMSTTTEATMHVPSYAAWLETIDQSSAYEYTVRLMKLLQWQRPARRWVLKTPHHMEFLDLVDKYYGDVQYIWTHRNVYESIPSFLSMLSYSRIIFSRDVDKHEVAEHWIRKTGHMLDRALDFHEANNHRAKFTDVIYDKFIQDPLGVLSQVYMDRSEPLPQDLRKIFEKVNRENPQGKYGRHKYSLDDFGIDREYIDRYTGRYQDFRTAQEKI